jgi:chitin-binding protein
MLNLGIRFGFGILGAVAMAWSHGLIVSPPSRNFICGMETIPAQVDFGGAKTQACSTAFAVNPMAAYNYMAVLTHSWGRAEVTPLPKHVCGFDGETWKGAKTPWDTAMAWPASPVTPGLKTFTWDITSGAHFADTRDFKYWITKRDFVFSPTRELSWSDFEETPFCALDYDDAKPTASPAVTTEKAKGLFHTQCTLPERNGHHVVYAEWGRIEPTKERFHGCVDIAYGNVAPISQERPAAPASRSMPSSGMRSDLRGRLHNQTGMLFPLAPKP